MKPYTVLTVPNPKLRHKASPVAEVNDEIRTIFERMIVTMKVEDGIGLAATQVGIDKRLIVMNIEGEDDAHHHHDHDHEGGGCNRRLACFLHPARNRSFRWYSFRGPFISHEAQTHCSKSYEGCCSL